MIKKILSLVCALQLAGCAVSPVKPLYPSEAAKLKTIDLRISAPKEALSVQQLISATTVVNTGPAYGGAGILGAVIGAIIVDAIVNAENKKNADALRLELAGLNDQVAGMDYGSLVSKNLDNDLRKVAGDRIVAVSQGKILDKQGMIAAAKASSSDAVLFVDINHAFANAGPVRPGTASAIGGMNLGVNARVTLLSKGGEELVKDSYVFVTPQSADATNEARVTWWRDNDRYKQLLMRSGAAFATGLNEQVFGNPVYADAAQFEQRREADKKLTNEERTKRNLHVLARFRSCDDFHLVPLENTRFETHRADAVSPLRIGLVCDNAKVATTTP